MEFLSELAALAEARPLGLLVAFMLVVIGWLVRRLDRVTKDRDQMSKALFMVKAEGHELDETTQIVLTKLDKRRKVGSTLRRLPGQEKRR